MREALGPQVSFSRLLHICFRVLARCQNRCLELNWAALVSTSSCRTEDEDWHIKVMGQTYATDRVEDGSLRYLLYLDTLTLGSTTYYPGVDHVDLTSNRTAGQVSKIVILDAFKDRQQPKIERS